MRRTRQILRFLLLLAPIVLVSGARGQAALLMEGPYGHFGALNPTGHAAIYLSRVCAETPTVLRRCGPGEAGVVVSRYHRVSGYDWLAIPLIPYLYAVNSPDDVPDTVDGNVVAHLRDHYRREHLESVVPDDPDGNTPKGEWTQLVGESYDRKIYGFQIETSEEQDDALIEEFNSQRNEGHFNLLFRNCADFARKVINFYYPRSVHRNLVADAGIMTPTAGSNVPREVQQAPQ
jgi:hypothetical protein